MSDTHLGEPSATGPRVARYLASGLGGSASVGFFGDQDERTRTPILTCLGAPGPGWATSSTVELHRVPNLIDGRDVRVELMACAAESDPGLPDLLATAAFTVIKDGWLAAPGVVFPDLVAMYVPGTTTPHVMWAEPVNLPELSSVEITGVGDVHWLLAIPLSTAEVQFLHENGYDALDARLGSAGAEYVDLRRPSTV